MRYIVTILTFLLFAVSSQAQNILPPDYDSIRLASVRAKLVEVEALDRTYGEEVDISVGRIALSDMLRNIAKVSSVNLTVTGAENMMITCNFSRAKITDLIYFLCREYNLDIDVIGNIVAIRPATPPPVQQKIPKVVYAVAGNRLSYDLSGDSLIEVIKRITSLTGVNIVVPQNLYPRQVSGYVSGMSLDEAIFTLASVNGIEAQKNNGVWEYIDPPVFNPEQPSATISPAQPYTRRSPFAPNQLAIDSLGFITAQIGSGNIQDIVVDLCEKQGLNYFFVTPVNQQTSIFVRDVKFETLLGVLLSGTPFSYYRENDIYVFGNFSEESSLNSVAVIPLIFRSVSKVDELIPETIKAGVQVKVFADQNSIIASGDQRQVARVETFLRSIDKRVPLVTIEIIIADVKKSNIMEAGIGMGLGNPPTATSGTLSPGIDITMNATSVNSLLNSFSGFGSVNLGRVSPDFYMSLKFLEDNGTVQVHSTPKLSTLNGHEATMKSGEKQYYKEVTNTYMGSQNPIQSENYVWRDVEANLSIKIIPFVSEDGLITLDIEIEQSEFTARVENDGPPGSATRSFKSLIRIQNEEMVLLGGIDRNSVEKSASGLPFIARVPILKWFFGKSKNNKIDQKLNVFIKPTIID